MRCRIFLGSDIVRQPILEMGLRSIATKVSLFFFSGSFSVDVVLMFSDQETATPEQPKSVPRGLRDGFHSQTQLHFPSVQQHNTFGYRRLCRFSRMNPRSSPADVMMNLSSLTPGPTTFQRQGRGNPRGCPRSSICKEYNPCPSVMGQTVVTFSSRVHYIHVSTRCMYTVYTLLCALTERHAPQPEP
jgi:hypothetical protein